MDNKFQLYQQVQLTLPLPEHHFEKGDVATIVEIVSDKQNNTGYLLEFFDNTGLTLKVIAVPENAVTIPPAHSVVNYRPYEAA
ncbi:MAG: DUF4926 domain-containing protein [Bacteroidota bacterium]